VLPLYAGAWNPQSASEFIIGGASKVLKILDVRILAKDPQKCVVWKAEKAHADTIRDVAWSPLVSHWIASCGDDGCARIWDVRYGSRPVRVLQLNTHTVSSVAWSRAHCEKILTGGVDGNLRLWNLRLSPHYLASTEDDFSSSIVGCGWSPEHPLQYIGVSGKGEASVIQLGREFVTTFVNNRSRTLEQEFRKIEESKAITTATTSEGNNGVLDRHDRKELTLEQRDARSKTYEKMERNIERLLYLRDFDGAFKVICTLANDYWNDGTS
jgi:WD40 repeat protein